VLFHFNLDFNSKKILFEVIFMQVNSMFQQIAAQILGITLTRIQVEETHRVVKAEIVKFKEPKVAPAPAKKSSICVLQ